MEHILTVVLRQFGEYPMQSQHKQSHGSRPCIVASARAEARAAFDKLAEFCQKSDDAFWCFEKQLFVLLAALGACLIRLFLVSRRQRLDIDPYLQDGGYRLGAEHAQRTLKTAYGEVTYARHYLI